MVDVNCFVLLALWITGDMFKIDATITAFIGLSLLLLTSVLTWEDIKGEKAHGIPLSGLQF